ncbi:MAG: M14 family zinc carboxypeptidase [Candidatus Eisenbacteria bacterium]
MPRPCAPAGAAVFALLLALSAAPAFGAVSAPGGSLPQPRKVRVILDAPLSITALLEAGLDIVEVHGPRDVVIFEWPGDVETLERLGATPMLLDANPGATEAARAREELTARPGTPAAPVRSSIRGDGRYRIEMLPPFGSGSMGGYWTLDEVKMKLDSLVASDANDVVADQLDSLGVSRQGRTIWGLRLGRSVVGPDTRPAAFFNSLTHAREPIGMQSLFYFVDDLLAGYGSDPWKTYLLDERRIYICPVVNPDGYQANVSTYVGSGGASFGNWRKNARDNNNSGTFNAGDGVDLNRNFGFQWGLNSVGSSGTPSSDLYRGPSAFSEPETQAQRDLVVALQPRTAISFHTYSDLWLHPWGYQVAATSDSASFYEWNDEAMAGIGYSAGQAPRVLYEVNGEFNDWCYGETVLKPRLFSWTPEVGSQNDGFWPAPSRIVPLSRESLRGCYTVAAVAGPYVRVERAEWGGGALLIGGLGNVEVFARNIGRMSSSSGLNATLVSLDPGAEVLSGPISYPTLGSRTSGAPAGDATFLIGTVDTLTPGRLLRFRVEFRDDGGLYCRDTLEVPAGLPTLLLNEPSNNFANWVIGGNWGTVSNNAAHPSRYFADSPFGVYVASYNGPFTMKGRLDLSAVLHAYAFFDARWSFESDYDGCVVEASLDSVNWVPLTGRASTAGLFPPQPTGQPVYEGHRYNWRPERLDLSPFCGPTASAVRFRFRSMSDAGTEFDGMSFDSLRIQIYDPAAQPAAVAVAPHAGEALEFDAPAPNPARGSTTFAWGLPRAGYARLEILDLAGRRVATLADGHHGAHRYVRGWDLRDDRGVRANPGIYFARLSTRDGVRLRRLVVLH